MTMYIGPYVEVSIKIGDVETTLPAQQFLRQLRECRRRGLGHSSGRIFVKWGLVWGDDD